MGLPLAPVLANLFLSYYEKKWINQFDGIKPDFYRRYMDDIFCVFNGENDAKEFFDHLNSRHPSINFTMELENDHKLAFLDVLIDNSHPDSITTSIYRKSTFTGLLTNFNSFTAFSYKTGLIKTLIDRMCKINNTWIGFHKDLENLRTIFIRNCYPSHLVDKIFERYMSTIQSNNPIDASNQKTVKYFKLPFIGNYSKIAQKKLMLLSKRYCKTTLFKLAFRSFKVGDLLSPKDKIPFALKSGVVYKFVCGGCRAAYIGETRRHLTTRIKEHLRSNKSSHVFIHLDNNPNCKRLSNESCFSILDSDSNQFKLRLKEGLIISKEHPVLNAQLTHELITLYV